MEEKKEIMVKESAVNDLNISYLFSEAIKKDASVDTLERLMKIREDVKKEKAREEFFSKLNEFQARCGKITTNRVVYNKDGTVRYKYATLEHLQSQIKDLLSELGFSYSFETELKEKNLVRVSCILRHNAGHSEKSSFDIYMDTSSYMTDIQRMGSTLTYAKRYSLLSVLGITIEGEGEDDDGNLGQATIQERQQKEFNNNDTYKKPAPFLPVPISELKKYYIILNKVGVDKNEAKELLKGLFNTDTLKELNKEQFTELMDLARSFKSKEDFLSYLSSVKNVKDKLEIG